jgi:hypothetical protein
MPVALGKGRKALGEIAEYDPMTSAPMGKGREKTQKRHGKKGR